MISGSMAPRLWSRGEVLSGGRTRVYVHWARVRRDANNEIYI